MVYPGGQVEKALSGFYHVYADGEAYQTRAWGNFHNRKITSLVGDEVFFENDNLTDGYVLKILPGRNELVRPPVVNVDLGVVVMNMVSSNFSFNLLDCFLVSLEYKDIEPVIYLTKVDLLDEPQRQQITEIKQIYEALGYAVVASEDVEVTEKLERFFPERLTVFMGQSGAGKSTLLNQILPELQLAAAETSQSLGRGKHATHHVELIPLYGGLVAGTPEFSVIDFLEMGAVKLPKQFPEFVTAASHCKSREYMHHREPGCEVKRQMEAGTIATSRYENYLRSLMEIKDRRPVYKEKS